MEAAEGTGYATRNDFKLTKVNVRCKPHRHIDGQPVAYEVFCTREVQGKWDCSHAEEKLFVAHQRHDIQYQRQQQFGASR